MVSATVYMTEEQFTKIKALSERTHVAMAIYIRQAIDIVIAQHCGVVEQDEFTTDGFTVWVNRNGHCIGRFSSKGIDVHAPPGSKEHCLDCRPGSNPLQKLPLRSEWDDFRRSMKFHYNVDVPKDLLKKFFDEKPKPDEIEKG